MTDTISTQHLELPTATLAYDVHGPLPTSDGRPPLLMIGQPMDARGFATLASLFPERTVVTYDPRGLARSTRRDGSTRNSPAQQADDLHHLVTQLGAGPVDLFASSGGAVTALALVSEHPADVRSTSRAVSESHVPNVSGIQPVRARAAAPSVTGSWPSTRTVPASGVSSPARTRVPPAARSVRNARRSRAWISGGRKSS